MHSRFAIAAAALAALSTAWAVSAHFNSATGTVEPPGSLRVDFKEVGLGNNTMVDYSLSTDASAVWQCFNSGSNSPQGSPYQMPDQTLTATGSFASGKNGSINASIHAGPPDPAPAEAALKCVSSGNKKLCLMSVSYSGTTLTDSTFNVSIGVTPDPNERSFPVPTRRSPTPDSCVTSL